MCVFVFNSTVCLFDYLQRMLPPPSPMSWPWTAVMWRRSWSMDWHESGRFVEKSAPPFKKKKKKKVFLKHFSSIKFVFHFLFFILISDPLGAALSQVLLPQITVSLLFLSTGCPVESEGLHPGDRHVELQIRRFHSGAGCHQQVRLRFSADSSCLYPIIGPHYLAIAVPSSLCAPPPHTHTPLILFFKL